MEIRKRKLSFKIPYRQKARKERRKEYILCIRDLRDKLSEYTINGFSYNINVKMEKDIKTSDEAINCIYRINYSYEAIIVAARYIRMNSDIEVKFKTVLDMSYDPSILVVRRIEFSIK